MADRTSEQLATALRLTVDRDRCRRCYSLEAKLFDCDDAGYPVVLDDVVPAGLEPNAQNAAENCPESSSSLARA